MLQHFAKAIIDPSVEFVHPKTDFHLCYITISATTSFPKLFKMGTILENDLLDQNCGFGPKMAVLSF